MKKATIFLVLTGILTNACIDQLNVNIDREESVLVVEGAITTQPGPHSITISRSAKYGSTFDAVIKSVTNAQVVIRDQNGEVTVLTNADFGLYQTPPGFRAVVGNSYSLQISVLNKTYYSTPQLVTQAPAIDSLILSYKEFPSLDPIEFAAGDFVSGVEVYSRWQDPPGESNFYMWQSYGTYKIFTQPWNFTVRPQGGGPPIPAPKGCCAVCWINEPPTTSIEILKDTNFDGIEITSLSTFIKDEGTRYQDKYFVTVELHSISKEAFFFFDLLDNQLSIAGNIFDPPPATIRGNMLNLENPDENVIGFFLVSDVATRSVFIPNEILEQRRNDKEINDDCRTLRGATASQPIFWE